MDWNSFDQLVRLNFELFQYVAFSVALVLFGVLETVIAFKRDGILRVRRWPANGVLTVANIFVMGVLPISVIAVADHAMAEGWGLLNQPYIPPVLALILGFILRSLISYCIHVAMHKIPVLWRVHRVHHTDIQLDVSTTVRFHPLEFAISLPMAIGMVVLLGIPPLALMLYEMLDAVMAVFTHANVRVSEGLDRWLRLVIVTPAMHRIHHSAWQPETDSNFGATISWWDRIFGTYRRNPQSDMAAMQLGLSEYQDPHTVSLARLFLLPFAARGRVALQENRCDARDEERGGSNARSSSLF